MTRIGDTRTTACTTARTAPADGPRDAAAPALALLAGAWLESAGSANTRRAYRRDLEEWTSWLGEREVGLLEASSAHVEGWAGALERDGRAPATRSRKLSGIGSFYRYAMDEGHRFGLLVTSEPTARSRRPYLDRRGPACLTVEQARGVLRAADAEGPRAGAIVRLILETGLGVREITGARIQDLGRDGAHRTLTVPPGGVRRRRVVLPADLAYVVGQVVGGRGEGPVISTRAGRRVADSQVFRTVRLAGEGAGVSLTPQRLRDACAILALDAGARLRDVQSLLGHTGRCSAPGDEGSGADLAEAPSCRVAALLGCRVPS
jgi:integrase/recombinase XerD